MTLSHSIPHAKDGRNNSLRLMAEGPVAALAERTRNLQDVYLDHLRKA